VTVYLVRHARAGSRGRWQGDDALRPLSKVGRRQADGIAQLLGAKPLDAIVSSPSLRCTSTVAALAGRVDIEVETSDALTEGAPTAHALRLFEKLQDREAVLCTHGDVIQALLEHFDRHGVKVRDHRVEKGSVWVFDIGESGVEKARYLPPPRT
jgi:8-oxo-dGTP diphosphatase